MLIFHGETTTHHPKIWGFVTPPTPRIDAYDFTLPIFCRYLTVLHLTIATQPKFTPLIYRRLTHLCMVHVLVLAGGSLERRMARRWCHSHPRSGRCVDHG